ncbi:MAG: hypothetical protein RLZZ422_1066 [Pseudomonadota bacterium]|jgi:predicted amidophosphoribosyltransferase
MTIELKGNWKLGFAYDVHTLDSTYLGVDEHGHNAWQTTRSEMGELVYRLKYQGDISILPDIIELLSKFKGLESMDVIVPVPSSNKNRRVQPVDAIAKALSEKLNVRLGLDVLVKHKGSEELKNIDDPQQRLKLLSEQLELNNMAQVMGKNVLLVDDLYRSGSTLSVATDLLYKHAKVKDVFVLVMTKTRSKR